MAVGMLPGTLGSPRDTPESRNPPRRMCHKSLVSHRGFRNNKDLPRLLLLFRGLRKVFFTEPVLVWCSNILAHFTVHEATPAWGTFSALQAFRPSVPPVMFTEVAGGVTGFLSRETVPKRTFIGGYMGRIGATSEWRFCLTVCETRVNGLRSCSQLAPLAEGRCSETCRGDFAGLALLCLSGAPLWNRALGAGCSLPQEWWDPQRAEPRGFREGSSGEEETRLSPGPCRAVCSLRSNPMT